MKATTITHRPLPTGAASHYGRGRPDDPKGEVENEDFASMLCRFEGGATGTFEVSRTMVGPESQNAFEVYGTKGALAWNLERINELQYYRSGRRATPATPRSSAATASRSTAPSCPGRRTRSASRTSSRSRTTRSSSRSPPAQLLARLPRGRRRGQRPAGTDRLVGLPHVAAGRRPRSQGGLMRAPSGSPPRRRSSATSSPSGSWSTGRGAAVPRRDRDLRARQRHQPGSLARDASRRDPGVARPERAGHGAGGERRSPRRCGASRSWCARRRSVRAPPTWSPLPAWPWRTASRCSSSPATPSPRDCRIPVLQQVEHFGHPSTTVNDAFRPVVRYWDRITHPAQVLRSLPQAVGDHARPGRLRPCFHRPAAGRRGGGVRLPRSRSSAPRCTRSRDPARTSGRCARRGGHPCRAAPGDHRRRRRPLLTGGGGARAFAERFGIPVVETVAGKSSPAGLAPAVRRPIGVTGADAANVIATEADLVIAVGTRLEDFTTGSWTVVRRRRPHRRRQRGALRRDQAPRAAGGRRCS